MPIPILPTNVQIKIEEAIKEAWERKKEAEKKIKDPRNNVNEILTNYLQIKLPIHEDEFFFITTSTDIVDRLDVDFHCSRYTKLIKVIKSSPYDVKTLREISRSVVSGQRPKGGVKYIEEGVPSIGGEHITSEGDFNFGNIRYIPKEFHKNQKKSWIKPFDILIVKDGATTGKVAIVPEDFPLKESNINEHVFKIEVERGYNPYYIFSYLFSSIGQEQINRLMSGAAQKGVTREAIEKVKIIVPPAELQDKIVDGVKKRREESKKLKEEAKEVVEKAKKEVEKMMAGES